MELLEMSFSASILIIVIILLRTIFLYRLPKKTFMILWAIVLFRLLVPVSIPSSYSVYSWVSKINLFIYESREEKQLDTSREYLANTTPISVNEKDILNANQRVETVPFPRKYHVSLWFIIWSSGFVLCIGCLLYIYVKSILRFSISLPIESEWIKKWQSRHKLRRNLSIRQSEKVSSPLSYGLFYPIILLPKNIDFQNTQLLECVLTHEYMHIRHLDIVSKALMLIALSIHWFNPMVWMMLVLFNRDIELTCDESVIKALGENNKSSYANSLIDMEVQKSECMPLCNCFSKNAIEERMISIMKTKKYSLLSFMMAGIMVTSVGTVFATTGKEEIASKINKSSEILKVVMENSDIKSESGYRLDPSKVIYEFKEEDLREEKVIKIENFISNNRQYTRHFITKDNYYITSITNGKTQYYVNVLNMYPLVTSAKKIENDHYVEMHYSGNAYFLLAFDLEDNLKTEIINNGKKQSVLKANYFQEIVSTDNKGNQTSPNSKPTQNSTIKEIQKRKNLNPSRVINGITAKDLQNKKVIKTETFNFGKITYTRHYTSEFDYYITGIENGITQYYVDLLKIYPLVKYTETANPDWKSETLKDKQLVRMYYDNYGYFISSYDLLDTQQIKVAVDGKEETISKYHHFVRLVEAKK